jgi:hypothetical protein
MLKDSKAETLAFNSIPCILLTKRFSRNAFVFHSIEMAISTNSKLGFKIPPLSLIPEDDVLEDRSDSTKYCSFKLLMLPGTAGSTTAYYFTLLSQGGRKTVDLRTHQVVSGRPEGLRQPQRHCPSWKERMSQEMCSGGALTVYPAGVDAKIVMRHNIAKQLAREAIIDMQPWLQHPKKTP